MLEGGIPLVRIFGIHIKLHYSWFIVFALITWALAVSYFPSEYPNWASATYWGIGLATSLLFFLSVLIHELAHSVIAQGAGIPIKSITLFVFGGVSQMTKEPEQPAVEFRMALAGPVTSLIIGGIFWGIWAGVRGFNEPLAGLAFWLGWINVVLAGFNLIPGFPLDGGRVLRSILWWRRGNVRSATQTASMLGRVVGYLFIFGGVWWIFTGYWINGLWIAFIGWFLENAAVGSYRQVAIQDILKGHSAGEVMTRDCPTVPPRLAIDKLIHDHILDSARRCFPVVENSHLIGLVTIHDIKKVHPESRSTKTVSDVMTPFEKLKWVKPGDDLSDVLNTMTMENVNQLPVVENGNVIGMVGRDNLLSFIRIRGELGM
jgi:Zn-dependent protease/CBS domain-containing protein